MVDQDRRVALAAVIAKLRSGRGLAESELADLVDVSTRTIKKIEAAKCDPEFTLYWAIANAFGMGLVGFSQLVIDECTTPKD